MARIGFWSRSLDELKRRSKIGEFWNILVNHQQDRLTKTLRLAWNLEGIKGATTPYELFSFRNQASMQECAPFSDADLGGFSRAELEWVPPNEQADPSNPAENPNGHARFHGSISIRLPVNNPKVERTGYAAWRTYNRPMSIFGRSLWDIDPYMYLALRIKSDGRSYLVNLQTESVEPTDLHQHRLFTTRPGEWETVLISWNDFVRTNRGRAIEPASEMLRQKVRTIGIGLTDRVPGPFTLCIERIWATNNRGDANRSEAEAATAKTKTAEWKRELLQNKEGQLKNKEGKSINWD